jgi:hypothetical protein
MTKSTKAKARSSWAKIYAMVFCGLFIIVFAPSYFAGFGPDEGRFQFLSSFFMAFFVATVGTLMVWLKKISFPHRH